MIVSFLTEQGGVGKTSLVFNLGWYLSDMGKKVLLIDLDPQGGNLSRLLGVEDLDNQAGVVDILKDPETYDFKNTAINIKENMDLIPANEDAKDIPSLEIEPLAMKKSLDKIKKKYDYIFIDSSPAPSDAHILALGASDRLLIPLIPDAKSIDATENVIDTFNVVKKELNKKIEILGLVYNQYEQRSTISKLVQQTLQAAYRKKKIIFTETKIPKNVAITEAWAFKTGVTEYRPKSKGAVAIKELAKELFGIEETEE